MLVLCPQNTNHSLSWWCDHDYEPPEYVLTLELCVAVLEAINEDSSTVPTLLTDYILKGLFHLSAALLVGVLIGQIHPRLVRGV